MIKIQAQPGSYAIHRFAPGQKAPEIPYGFHSLTRSDEETSLVCLEEIEIASVKKSIGWKCLKVVGPLALDQAGILYDLSLPLKQAGIPIFAISTYDTDYLLVPGNSYERALEVLSESHLVIRE